jgi:DNA-binding beta-propeller fold protein YncE
VRVDSDAFTVAEVNFINAGPGGSNSVAVSGPWVFASGYWAGLVLPPLVNLVRIANRDGVVVSSGLESVYRVSDARDIAVSSDGKRLFLLGVTPDTLLTFSITDTGGVPALSLLRGVPIPDGPSALAVIPRPGRGDLVVFSSKFANSVSIYDEEVGDVVTHVQGVGSLPAELAVDLQGTGARVYVSLFADGRIGVIDIPDVNRPQGARLVARLGPTQFCQSLGSTSPGCVASQAEVAQ